MSVVATELPPLAALIRERHESGRSYREMAETARRAGKVISHAQLQAYATDGVRKAPSPEQMEALAAALEIPFEQIRAAMIEQFYGYIPRHLSGGEQGGLSGIVPADLTPEEQEQLRRLVEAWIASRPRND